MKVTIVGAGAFGTAIGTVIAGNGHSVRLWSYEEDVAQTINEKHENTKYLPGVKTDEKLTVLTSMKEALNEAEVVLFITPSAFTERVASQAKEFVPNNAIIGCMAKGFAEKEGRPILLLQALGSVFTDHKDKMVYISGPTHAEEIGKGMYSGLVASSFSEENAKTIMQLLDNEFVKVYYSKDPIGAQVAAALKNIIAIFYGILDGLKEDSDKIGDNALSYVYARGLIEMVKVARLFGDIRRRTILGLAGAGDLLVTCSSLHGRNRRFGYQIVKEKLLEKHGSLENTLKNIDYLPEGAYAIKYVMELEEIEHVKLPLMEMLWDILQKKKSPEAAMEEYMKESAHEEDK